MIYYALIKQVGEGCDYTIGCGRNWKRLEATTLEEATQEALTSVHITDFEVSNERQPTREIESIQLLAVAEEHDLSAAIESKVQEDIQAWREQQRAAKLEQLKQLQRELGEG